MTATKNEQAAQEPAPSMVQSAPPVDQSDEGDTASEDPRSQRPAPTVAVLGLLFWVGVGFGIALLNDSSRSWIQDHWAWFSPAAGLAVIVAVVAVIAVWARTQSAPMRAAVYLLVVFPAIALGTAGIFWMPTAGQLVALRAVVLCVLVCTPALMWWLFIATQRASLLNEFIANLDRLGLLDVAPDASESDSARETRISSYLQKFEATYGGLPRTIRTDVVDGEFRSYSSEEAKDRTSLTAAAVPVTLSLVTLLVGWILVLPPVDTFPLDPTTNPRWLLALSPNTTPVTFAFLGAYFFSMQMLYRRYVRGDLRGSAYIAVVLRVVLAVVGIWVLQGIGKQGGWTNNADLLVIAFVIGVFPVVVWQVISGAASKIFDFALPSLQSRLPLSQLDGLTVWHESRLEEEDVENVQNMATVDIVDLLVNTRIPVPRLIDWIDQSILLTHLGLEGASNEKGSPRHRLAQHGVRTASALLKRAASVRTDAETAAFHQIVVDDTGNSVIPSLLTCIGTDDNLTQVLRWHGLDSRPVHQERN